MTHVIEYAIEETLHYPDGQTFVTCDRVRTTPNLSDAVAEATKTQDRFNRYARDAGGNVSCTCIVIEVEKAYANNHLYSDVQPFEIVRVVSDKTIEVRAMDAEMAPDWKPEIISGGFSGHCVNNHKQRDAWVITSNEANPVIRIRKQKDGSWKNPSFGRFHLAEKPFKKYDFNF